MKPTDIFDDHTVIIDIPGNPWTSHQREFSRERKGDGSYRICYHIDSPMKVIRESWV
jgi:hypothetical protein